MNIVISNSTSTPIYVQIAEQIKKSILSEQIDEGEILPSIRSLAKDLHISVITTKNAYEILEREGLIESIQGKGFFVAAKNKELIKEKKMNLIEEKLFEIIEEAKNYGLSQDDIINLIEILYEQI